MSSSIDLFVKTYRKDFWIFSISLETIKRNVTGYKNLIILVPERDKEFFETRYLPERSLVFYVADEGEGYLRQQHYKMTANKYSSADYIMYSDSDILFNNPLDVSKIVKDNKPEVLYTSWDKVGQAVCWKAPTEAFIGEPVAAERMRRNNQCIHRSTLEGIEKFAPDLEQTIMSSHSFSEFNAIMAYAYKYENEKYTWIDTDNWEYVPPAGIQIWSYANKEPGASETHLREYIKTLESIMVCFGVPVPNP